MKNSLKILIACILLAPEPQTNLLEEREDVGFSGCVLATDAQCGFRWTSMWVTNLLEEGEDVGFGGCILAADAQCGSSVPLSDEQFG